MRSRHGIALLSGLALISGCTSVPHYTDRSGEVFAAEVALAVVCDFRDWLQAPEGGAGRQGFRNVITQAGPGGWRVTIEYKPIEETNRAAGLAPTTAWQAALPGATFGIAPALGVTELATTTPTLRVRYDFSAIIDEAQVRCDLLPTNDGGMRTVDVSGLGLDRALQELWALLAYLQAPAAAGLALTYNQTTVITRNAGLTPSITLIPAPPTRTFGLQLTASEKDTYNITLTFTKIPQPTVPTGPLGTATNPVQVQMVQ